MPKIYSDWYQSPSGNWYNKNVCQGCTAHVKAICDECGEEFFNRKHKAKGRKGGNNKKFCSSSCRSKATVRIQDLSHLIPYRIKKGQTPHNFKGGYVRSKDGRKIITGNGKIILEYRQIVELFLGRQLKKGEVIHHVNGDTTDNRLENLRLMTQSEHMKLHWEQGDFDNRVSLKKGGN